MKVLLVNKFYYPKGGDCIYTIELEKLLIKHDHEVAVFSMQHQSNLDSEYSDYFPGSVDFNRKSLKNILTMLIRPFGSMEVRRKFIRLISDFKPDVLHLNNIHSQLSPVIARIAHKRNIPIVWTLHDYKLICPAYLFLTNNKICEACLKNKYSVIRFRCIKKSRIASILAYFEALYWNLKMLNRITDMFISPSNFLFQKMLEGGGMASKIMVMNNFVNTSKFISVDYCKQNYYCFVGRFSSEKGIETLLKAATAMPHYPLKLVGTGPLEDYLKSEYNSSHIEFLGYKNWDELKSILSHAQCLVIPSEWYENNPLIVLESLCLGTPVIGSDIGGIPELIIQGVNGLLFEPGNDSDLQSKINMVWQNPDFDSQKIAIDAREKYNSQSYYEKLNKIYLKLFVK